MPEALTLLEKGKVSSEGTDAVPSASSPQRSKKEDELVSGNFKGKFIAKGKNKGQFENSVPVARSNASAPRIFFSFSPMANSFEQPFLDRGPWSPRVKMVSRCRSQTHT